jgi:hypothetical protein
MDPIIKADSLAYPMLHVPDLDKQEQFLIHFGIIASDILQPPPADAEEPIIGIFARLDRGGETRRSPLCFLAARQRACERQAGAEPCVLRDGQYRRCFHGSRDLGAQRL